MIEINKLKSQTQRYDAMFGTRSRIFPPDIILVSTSLDSWQIIITNKQKKPICLLHKNKFGRTNKYHIQGRKTCLYHAYHSMLGDIMTVRIYTVIVGTISENRIIP